MSVQNGHWLVVLSLSLQDCTGFEDFSGFIFFLLHLIYKQLSMNTEINVFFGIMTTVYTLFASCCSKIRLQ